MIPIVKKYADALFQLAWDEGVDGIILTEFDKVRGLLDENPDYVRLLDAPNIPRQERVAVLDEALSGAVHPYLLSFLKLLSERCLCYYYRYAALRYRTCYNLAHGRIEAVATTAKPLRPDQLERLRLRLEEVTGKQVDMENRVDPSVLGGVCLEYECTELDGTLRQRLDGIGKTLSDTVV